MDSNVVVLTFDQESKAYQALSELKQMALEGRVQVQNAAVIDRGEGESFRIRDAFSDGAPAGAPLTGTLLGSLIGVLGGPLGVLLGAASGALVGSALSIDKLQDRASLLDQMLHSLPRGATGVIAAVREPAVEVIDGLASRLGGVVLRRPTAAVQAEVDAVRSAEQSAAAEARKVLREKQKDEWRGKFDNWKNELGERWDTLKNKITQR
jgi:uncharacterized membrane protein